MKCPRSLRPMNERDLNAHECDWKAIDLLPAVIWRYFKNRYRLDFEMRNKRHITYCSQAPEIIGLGRVSWAQTLWLGTLDESVGESCEHVMSCGRCLANYSTSDNRYVQGHYLRHVVEVIYSAQPAATGFLPKNSSQILWFRGDGLSSPDAISRWRGEMAVLRSPTMLIDI